MNRIILAVLKNNPLSYTKAVMATFIGVLPLLFMGNIPSINNSIIITLIFFLLIIFIKTNSVLKFFIFIIMAFLWACWHSNYLLEKMDLLTNNQQSLKIVIISVPLLIDEREKIKVKISQIGTTRVFPPIYAIWQVKHKSDREVCAGQVWQVHGILRPTHSSINEGGFDQQRFNLSQRVIGTLRPASTVLVESQCSIRQRVINHFAEKLPTLKNAGIIYALMFGERGMLAPELSALLNNTGLSHLIAISGLHIGMAYLFGWWLARLLLYLLPSSFIHPIVPLIFGLGFAIIYAWVSGFAIPATRALIALVLWIYIKQQYCHYFSWQWAIWSIGLIIIADPLAILSDSFWLSSCAVLAILYWFTLFPLSFPDNFYRLIKATLLLIHLQIGLLLLLTPIQIVLFQGINPMSFWANLWFVPIVSWLVVPLILLLFLVPIPALQSGIFFIIDNLITIGIKPLPYVNDYWFSIHSISVWLLLFCWLICLFLAFNWYRTYIGLLGCLVALCFGTENVPRQLRDYQWSLTTLDVGHGLAIVIEQKSLAYLYDTGNRWSGGSNASRQIIPYLKRKKVMPIGVILSHNHLDHTGGVGALSQKYPWVNIRSSFGSAKHLPCYKGQRWRWGILTFEVLWPEKLSKVSHNNDSCVIQLTDGYHKILLTGDLEKQGEKAITALYKRQLESDILYAPHHGSNTSSTPLFIRKVKPIMVIVSSARYSPWKIPSDKVYLRYKNNNIKWINTAESGQVTLWFKTKNIKLSRYRQEIAPRWYHLWFGDPQFPE